MVIGQTGVVSGEWLDCGGQWKQSSCIGWTCMDCGGHWKKWCCIGCHGWTVGESLDTLFKNQVNGWTSVVIGHPGVVSGHMAGLRWSLDTLLLYRVNGCRTEGGHWTRLVNYIGWMAVKCGGHWDTLVLHRVNGWIFFFKEKHLVLYRMNGWTAVVIGHQAIAIGWMAGHAVVHWTSLVIVSGEWLDVRWSSKTMALYRVNGMVFAVVIEETLIYVSGEWLDFGGHWTPWCCIGWMAEINGGHWTPCCYIGWMAGLRWSLDTLVLYRVNGWTAVVIGHPCMLYRMNGWSSVVIRHPGPLYRINSGSNPVVIGHPVVESGEWLDCGGHWTLLVLNPVRLRLHCGGHWTSWSYYRVEWLDCGGHWTLLVRCSLVEWPVLRWSLDTLSFYRVNGRTSVFIGHPGDLYRVNWLDCSRQWTTTDVVSGEWLDCGGHWTPWCCIGWMAGLLIVVGHPVVVSGRMAGLRWSLDLPWCWYLLEWLDCGGYMDTLVLNRVNGLDCGGHWTPSCRIGFMAGLRNSHWTPLSCIGSYFTGLLRTFTHC